MLQSVHNLKLLVQFHTNSPFCSKFCSVVPPGLGQIWWTIRRSRSRRPWLSGLLRAGEELRQHQEVPGLVALAQWPLPGCGKADAPSGGPRTGGPGSVASPGMGKSWYSIRRSRDWLPWLSGLSRAKQELRQHHVVKWLVVLAQWRLLGLDRAEDFKRLVKLDLDLDLDLDPAILLGMLTLNSLYLY